MTKKLLLVIMFLFFSKDIYSFENTDDKLTNENILQNSNTNIFDNTFVKNQGQWADDILFVGFSDGVNLILKKDGLYIDAYKKESINAVSYSKKGSFIKYEFLNSNFTKGYSPIIEAKNISEHKTNFIFGQDQSKWVYGVRTYKNIIQKNIYDNIDLALSFDTGSPRYDFVINPGGELSNLQIRLEGASILESNSKELTLMTNIGNLYNGKLKTFQNVNGKQVEIASSFKFYNNQFKFEVAEYNKNLPLIIDPIIYASYLGGNGNDEVNSVKRISDDKFVVVGSTESSDFPVSPGAYQKLINGGKDVFMIIYKNYGRFFKPEYATFIGGAGNDLAVGVGVDNTNNIYISGTTNSNDFPVSSNPLKNTNSGGIDCFFAKFISTDNTPEFMSYLGGSGDDYVKDMLVRPNGSIYLVGQTFSSNFPKVGGLSNNTNRGAGDGFVLQVNSSGVDLAFSNFFGGTAEDVLNAIDVDDNDNIYLAGATKSVNIPLVPIPSGGFSPDSPYQGANNGGWDACIVKMNKGGGSIYSSTYFGGSADDFGTGVVSNGGGQITFAGHTATETNSTKTFPKRVPLQDTHAGGIDAFIGKLGLVEVVNNRRRQDLMFSTYFGGRSDDYVSKLRRNAGSNSLTLYGITNSNNLPLTGAEVDKIIGNTDFYIAEFDDALTGVSYCTYLGTKGEDISGDFAYDVSGSYFVVGTTKTKDFIGTENSIQPTFGGGDTDGFITKRINSELAISTPSGGATYCPGQDINVVWSAGDLANPFTIGYYRESDKLNLNIISDKVTTKSYKWTIPANLPAFDDYVIYVSHVSGAYDVINTPFKVSAAAKINGIAFEGTAPTDSICEGGSLSMKVDAIGNELKYQWRHKGVNITGQTTNTLILTNITAAQAGDYDVVVNGTCSNNLTSTKLSFKVLTNPIITTQPTANTKILVGEGFELSTNATGSNVMYQWQKNGENIIGETTNKLKVTNAQLASSGKYKCLIDGSCGNQLSTDEATVEVEIGGGVSENDFENQFVKINSYEDILNIQINSQINGKIYVVNSNGVIIENLLTGNIISQSLEYNTNNLNSGVYWLVIENNSNADKFKFIVTK